jgi:hypothetical protein
MLLGMPHSIRIAFAAVSAVSLATAVARAETAWDGAEVTRLATELHATLGEGLALARVAPPQETAFQQRTRDAAVTEMKRAHEIAGEYSKRLRGGQSREDSENFFRQLRAIIADARQTADHAVPSAEIARLLERADQLVREIGGYYSGA